MDKKVIGVIGAITGLATLDTTAQAAPAATPTPDPVTGARSFAELLDPIPNAVAALRAADTRAAQERTTAGDTADVQLAQYHHHHHRYYNHHHNHHHHHRVGRIIRQLVAPRHHHHHHHHNHY
jgi:hypothetical protein